MANSSQSPFFTLPREIRMIVYYYVLLEDDYDCGHSKPSLVIRRSFPPAHHHDLPLAHIRGVANPVINPGLAWWSQTCIQDTRGTVVHDHDLIERTTSIGSARLALLLTSHVILREAAAVLFAEFEIVLARTRFQGLLLAQLQALTFSNMLPDGPGRVRHLAIPIRFWQQQLYDKKTRVPICRCHWSLTGCICYDEQSEDFKRLRLAMPQLKSVRVLLSLKALYPDGWSTSPPHEGLTASLRQGCEFLDIFRDVPSVVVELWRFEDRRGPVLREFADELKTRVMDMGMQWVEMLEIPETPVPPDVPFLVCSLPPSVEVDASMMAQHEAAMRAAAEVPLEDEDLSA